MCLLLDRPQQVVQGTAINGKTIDDVWRARLLVLPLHNREPLEQLARPRKRRHVLVRLRDDTDPTSCRCRGRYPLELASHADVALAAGLPPYSLRRPPIWRSSISCRSQPYLGGPPSFTSPTGSPWARQGEGHSVLLIDFELPNDFDYSRCSLGMKNRKQVC
jgi:hypothetical protein